MSVIEEFIRGASHLLGGYDLVLRPRLRRFVYVPLIVNTGFFVAAIALCYQALSGWVNPWLERLPGWLDWMQWLLLPLFGLFVLVLLFVTFTFTANLIGAPFNGLLADRCEQRLRPDTGPSLSRPWYLEIAVALSGELTKLRYYLVRALPLLVLSLVPVVGLLAWAALVVLTIWMLALQYLDYPLGNHGLAFPQQRALARRHSWLVLGFGSAVLLATLVPVINFTVMPAAVAGATRLVVADESGFFSQNR